MTTLCLVVFEDGAYTFDLTTEPAEVEHISRADRGYRGADHAHYKVESFTEATFVYEAIREQL